MQYVVELQKICEELVSALCPNLDKRNLCSYSIAAAAAATATAAAGIFAKSICVRLPLSPIIFQRICSEMKFFLNYIITWNGLCKKSFCFFLPSPISGLNIKSIGLYYIEKIISIPGLCSKFSISVLGWSSLCSKSFRSIPCWSGLCVKIVRSIPGWSGLCNKIFRPIPGWSGHG